MVDITIVFMEDYMRGFLNVRSQYQPTNISEGPQLIARVLTKPSPSQIK